MIDFEFRVERDDDARADQAGVTTDPETPVDAGADALTTDAPAADATGTDATGTDAPAAPEPPPVGMIVEAEGAGTVFEVPTADGVTDFDLPLPGLGFNYEFGQFY